MNTTLLRLVYRKNGIKKKRLSWYKQAKGMTPDRKTRMLATVKRLLTKAKTDGYRVVYIDETMFTRKTVPLEEWALPKQNMSVDLAKLEEPTLALLAGISKEKGLEHCQIFPKSVNVDKFFEYLAKLRAANGDAKIALFLDNLSAHTSKRSKAEMKRLGFRWIYNVPYSPE